MMVRGSPASLPSVKLEQFEGPLDLLLDECRRQNVDIEKIAMAPIVSRFLEYMRTAAGRNLNLDIDWLLMAATLIHWKSRSLLPSEDDGEPAVDPIRENLVRQLLAHRKQAAEELARRRSVEEARFSRVRDAELPDVRESDAPQEAASFVAFVSVWELIQQARELCSWLQKRREEQAQSAETLDMERDISVPGMIEYLRAQLLSSDGRKVDGVTHLREQPTASHRACLFLAMLEMASNRELQLEQNEIFGPVWLSI